MDESMNGRRDDRVITTSELRDHTVRPEQQCSADDYYNVAESQKYHFHNHTAKVQQDMTETALNLLHLDEGPKFVLDIGCGSGLSGVKLSENNHVWVGTDLSPEMLNIANQRAIRDFDLMNCDMGQNLTFRPGTFDCAISISVLQWLCYAHKKHEEPFKRLLCFFKWLREALNATGKAVLQFYPEHDSQIDMIRETCQKSGFTCGLVEEKKSEESNKRKLYLVCSVGTLTDPTMSKEAMEKALAKRRDRVNFKKKMGVKQNKKSRDWIMDKKDKQRNKKGVEMVRPDSRYTGRSRKRF